MSGGQRRWKVESYLTAPWQHCQDTLLLPRETLNPAFNSFGICMCVCLCERKCIDGWGECTDIPNPCKLSGLMKSVQLQAKIFVCERERTLCVFASMCVCAWSIIWKDQDPSLLMITQTLKMVFNIQSTLSPLSVHKSSSNLIYILIAERIPLTNRTLIIVLPKIPKSCQTILSFSFGLSLLKICSFSSQLAFLTYLQPLCTYVNKHTHTQT